MSHPSFHLRDEPSEVSLGILIRSLRDDSARKEISPKNYAHRLRVIRQQTELLGRQSRAPDQSGSQVDLGRAEPGRGPSA